LRCRLTWRGSMTELTFTVQGKDFFELRSRASRVIMAFMPGVDVPDYAMSVVPGQEAFGNNIPVLWAAGVTVRIP
jgi:hypothetical protein